MATRHEPERFPKIQAYLGEHDPLHLLTHVVCMEKIDGTNLRIGVAPGLTDAADIVIGGRELLEHEPGFAQAVLPDLIRKDAGLCRRLCGLATELGAPLTLHGEVCGGRIQSQGFIYGARPHLLLFGARIDGVWVGHGRALPRPGGGHSLPSLTQLAERLELPLAPLLYAGPPEASVFDELHAQPSTHSREVGFARTDVDATQEGIVIWSDPVLLTPFGTPIAAKLKVAHRREYRAPQDEGEDGLASFAARCMGRERLVHAREFLVARGRWNDDAPETMAEPTIRRAIQDVAREVPEYQAQLQRSGKKAVRAALRQAAMDSWKLLLDES